MLRDGVMTIGMLIILITGTKTCCGSNGDIMIIKVKRGVIALS